MYIYGTGGHSKVVSHTYLKNYKEKKIIFIDDKKKKSFLNFDVINFDFFNSLKLNKNLHIAIGNNSIRKKIFDKLDFKNIILKSIIEKNSYIYNTSLIADGCFVAAKSIIGPNSKIGKSSIINHSSIVDHDVIIGDFSHIAPGSVIGGGSQIGNLSLVGSNSVILPDLKIGNNVIIGSGSVVTKNIPNNTLVFGNPAKKKNIK